MVIKTGRKWRIGVTYMTGFYSGLESFDDGSWHLNVLGVEFWCHRVENPSVAERGAW